MDLKPIAREAVPRALAKAERYRLLNEPREAESICRDILLVEPGNQPALVCLILALTDLFDRAEARAEEAHGLVPRLADPYEREYYSGMIEERWAKALLESGYPGQTVRAHIDRALGHFDRADSLAPPGNDDAVLRWNTCVRLLQRRGLAGPGPDAAGEETESLDDDVPVR